MEETYLINHVAEFHGVFKHPISANPVIPSSKRCALRISLLVEELEELKEAIVNNDLSEIADALCDIQYVLSGTILEFGMAGKFKELFDEVHRSNMSKACSSLEEANQTIEYYKNNKNCDAYVQEEAGRFLVYRSNDNKTLKSINYSAPDLAGILGKSLDLKGIA